MSNNNNNTNNTNTTNTINNNNNNNNNNSAITTPTNNSNNNTNDDTKVTTYQFPSVKLKQPVQGKQNLVFVAAGSFNPITYMHLRMFEMARDWFALSEQIAVIGGYLSPVSDAYKKKELISSVHRIKMCELAVRDSDWLMVDTWEATRPFYTPTLQVLNHFATHVNTTLNNPSPPVQIALLCGADLLASFNVPGVWAQQDMEDICAKHRIVCLERMGTDLSSVIWENDILYKHKERIHLVAQWVSNDISSTKIRQALRRNLSIRYLIPDVVIDYIRQHDLYKVVSLSYLLRLHSPPDTNI